MTGSMEQGISQTHGNTHILHLLVRLPRSMEAVWPALATPDGLASWFTAADVFEPRLGGAITLRDLGEGRITAWDVERIAEYTLVSGERIRFHLERDGDTGSALRFTHEFQGAEDSRPRWRERFERLLDALDAAP
ncbi:SRPBCC domain-containing protein [Streptomyces sp. M41]|uniref:SRPBCC domain-containing protein n=1 Tax=Streptomyces sp. M41 TaxID=3059412 RepID=UPI00374CDCA7